MNDEKYTVGILGAGMMACGYDSPDSSNILTHAHAVTISEAFSLGGFFDIARDKMIFAANIWKAKYYETIDELIQECDVICCAVPDEAHYSVLKELINYKDISAIICEKPLAATAEEARLVGHLFEKYQIPFVVNYSRRFMRGFRRLKNNIWQMGSLIVGNCYYGKGLFHNCSHMINILDFLFGISEYKVRGVFDKIYDYFDQDPSVSFILQKEESRLYFHVIPCSVTTVFRFELCFEKGRIIYDDSSGELSISHIKESSLFPGYTNYTEDELFKADRNDALPLLYEEINGILNSHGENHSDMLSAINTIEMCQKIAEIANEKGENNE